MFRPACRLSAKSRRIPGRSPGVRIHLSVLSAIILILSPCPVTGDNGWDWLFDGPPQDKRTTTPSSKLIKTTSTTTTTTTTTTPTTVETFRDLPEGKTTNQNPCPREEGWKASDHSDFCFKIFHNKSELRSYSDAEHTCDSYGARLLSADEAEPQVLEHYTDMPALWVARESETECKIYNKGRRAHRVTPCWYKKGFICKQEIEPTTITSFTTADDRIGTANDMSTLACQTRGFPLPINIKIVKDSKTLVSSKDINRQSRISIGLDRTDCTSEGLYVCEVMTHTGKLLSRSVLTVWRLCAFRADKKRPELLTVLPRISHNDSAREYFIPLEIISDFYLEQLNLQWYRNGQKVKDTDAPTVNLDTSTDRPSSLGVDITIVSSRENDSPIWTFVITSHAGLFTMVYLDITNQDLPKMPLCPASLTVTGQTSYSVTLSWLPALSDKISGQDYQLFYFSESGQTTRPVIPVSYDNTSSVMSSTVEGLPADSRFLFWVAVENPLISDENDQPKCGIDVVMAKTDPSPCATNLTVAGQTTDSVSLSWLLGQSDVAPDQMFRVFYNISEDGQTASSDNVTYGEMSAAMNCTVEGLSPDTAYLFWVMALDTITNEVDDQLHCDIAIAVAMTDPEPFVGQSHEQEASYSVGNTLLTIFIVVATVAFIASLIGLFWYKRRAGLLTIKHRRSLLDDSNTNSFFNVGYHPGNLTSSSEAADTIRNPAMTHHQQQQQQQQQQQEQQQQQREEPQRRSSRISVVNPLYEPDDSNGETIA